MTTTKKKRAYRKRAATTTQEDASNKGLMVQVDPVLHQQFSDFRAARRDSRTFPWTVRDTMDVAIREYLANHAG